MFEEICLVCGKHLDDDGRAYCSDDCQQTDLSSPSISSSSSALSSPNMPPSLGPDVPPLMPSALGSALRVYAARSGPYSSASSASWSVLTDEEDEYRFTSSDYASYPYPDAADDAKSANFLYAASRLSYARRPSETNNHSTVPHLGHRRLSSGASSSRGGPRSAPMRASHDLEDDAYSDFSYMPPEPDADDADMHSEKAWSTSASSSTKYPGTATAKAKRARNRGSLPAYFSLLQMGPPKRVSPASSSANTTIARASPPTPKVPAPVIPSAQVQSQSQVHSTPRGRRRETDATSRSSRRSGRSSTPSRSRSRRTHINLEHLISPHFVEEEEIDWTTAPLRRRGREPVRRHSSPPPRVIMGVSVDPVADAARDLSMGRWTMQQLEWEERERGRTGSGSRSRSGRGREEQRERERERGRMRIEGMGTSNEAPGFGNGRSGLVARDRGAGVHMVRVPV